MFPLTISAQFFVSVVTIVLVLHIVLGICAYLIYLERKISAYIQDRIGPNRVGPIGLLQPIADGIKFLLKEDYAATGVDKALFTLAPVSIIIPALIGWAVVPWGGWIDVGSFSIFGLVQVEGGRALVGAANVDIGVIFLLAIASLGVYGVALGGWASNNKYSFLGGLRATAGMISYEIPLGLSILAIILLAGSVGPQRLIEMQVDGGWFILSQPLAAVLFYICIMAEANRAPFDNAEAESELVGGYHTEYSSMRFALFFLAEYAHMITSSAFFAILFLGGYHLPLVAWTSPEAVGLGPAILKFGVLMGKAVLSICFMMVLRWTLPRVRWDQVMKLAWNGLIPLGIAVVIGTAVLTHLGWTGLLPMLAMNVAMAVVVLAIQPLLPRSEVNHRVRLAGSRFNPLVGERVVTAPTHAMAREESGVATRESGMVSAH